jgi:MFS family permease
MIRRVAAGAALLLLATLLVLLALTMFTRDWRGPVPFVAGLIGALLSFWALFSLDPDRLREHLEFARAGLPIVAFAVCTVFVEPSSGTLGFDEVGAQIVVVLLLVLAIDTRFFRLRKDRDGLDRAAILFTMILLGAGEYYALQSLIDDQPRHSEMVAGAIAAGFVAVAVTALVGRGAAPKRERRGRSPQRTPD